MKEKTWENWLEELRREFPDNHIVFKEMTLHPHDRPRHYLFLDGQKTKVSFGDFDVFRPHKLEETCLGISAYDEWMAVISLEINRIIVARMVERREQIRKAYEKEDEKLSD